MLPFLQMLPRYIFVILAATAGLLSAASPLARIRCADPFSIDGIPIATPGVTSWPLVIGDEVASSTSAIVVTFIDGSSLRLGPSSRGRIAGSRIRPKFILLAGTLDFRLVPNSSLLVTNLDIERARANIPDVSPAVPFSKRAPSFPEPKFVLPPKASPNSAIGALVQLPPLSRHF